MTESSGEDKQGEQTAESTTTAKKAPARSNRDRAKAKDRPGAVHSVRSGLASAIWLLAVLAALILAVGALLVALGFNENHPLVDFVIQTALRIDLGEAQGVRRHR